MRYLVQFLIPALIVAGVVYLLTRRGGRAGADAAQDDGHADSDTGAFIVILLVSAAVALGTGFLLQAMWE